MLVAKKKPTDWSVRLKKLRNDLDITQAKAAEQAGVALRTWIAWENSQRVPGRIAQRLLKQSFPGHF